MSETPEPLLLYVLGAAVVVLLLMLVHARARSAAVARELFEEWRERELAESAAATRRALLAENQVAMQDWRLRYEAEVRSDAVARSSAVVRGKVAEHLAPYIQPFPYNPRDARFIGSPVDFVVFDGAEEGSVRQVVLIEVKTGDASLGTRQRQIRDAVRAGRVAWQEFRIG